mgnify:CR=1 FL=1
MSHWLQRIGQADADTFASLIAKLGNNTTAFWAAIGYEGATALASKLTAARAALLDQITALRMAELDAANIPADVDTLLARLTALRAGYLDELAAANIPADIDTLLARLTALRAGYLDNINQAGLLSLTAARAALLDQITALRMAELDAANIPADVDTLLARLTALRAGYLDNINQAGLLSLTALRAGYLDNLSAGAAALAAVCTAARLGELDSANIPADIDTLLARLTAARAGYLDELAAANIPADIDTLLARLTALRAGYLDNLSAGATSLRASQLRELYVMDFWSNPQEEVSIPAVAGTLTLPSVTVGDLPAGATVVRAIAKVKFRAIENTNVAANKLNDATVAATSQVIQVRSDAPGTWRDAINFVDDQFGVAASTREGGDVLAGSLDIAVEITANDTYEFRYLLALADVAALNWNDVQCGLEIWFSI